MTKQELINALEKMPDSDRVSVCFWNGKEAEISELESATWNGWPCFQPCLYLYDSDGTDE